MPPSLAQRPVAVALALGVLLWTADLLLSSSSPDDRTIHVSSRTQQALEAQLGSDGLPVSSEALQAQVDGWVLEEALVREARSLGLDEADPIVRRRLVQKMEFLVEEAVVVPEPTDEELQAWLRAHPQDFSRASTVDLEQVFFSRQRRGPAVEAEALSALTRLEQGASPDSLGDPFLHGRQFKAHTANRLRGRFGPELATALETLSVGEWAGPLPSSYGLHLVRITKRADASPPVLDEVRAQVAQAWAEDRESSLRQDALRRLVDRYAVEIEAQ